VADVGANATFTAPIFGFVRMSGIYWTLYVEVLFYALIPVLLFSDWRVALLSSYGVIAAYAAAAAVRVHVGPAPFFLMFCLLGMQFSFWARKQLSGRILTVNLAAATVGSTALPVLSPLLGVAPIICGLLLLWAIRYPFRQQLVEFFGRVSYSWYLLHPIVVMPVIVLAGIGKIRDLIGAKSRPGPPYHFTDNELTVALRRLLRRKGRLTRHIIQACRDLPCPSVYEHRFGSLSRTYQMIGYESGRANGRSNEQLLEALQKLLRKKGHLTMKLIDRSKTCPSSATYRARFGSLVQAYRLISYEGTYWNQRKPPSC
jgi:hypothetical protein